MRCPALLSCLSLLAAGRLLTASAQDLNVSLDHPVPPNPAHATNLQFVNEILLRMVDRWNAHDIEGLMSLYWNSPSLLAVIDTQQYEGEFVPFVPEPVSGSERHGDCEPNSN